MLDDDAPAAGDGDGDGDQTWADSDQTIADRDQTAADADQAASERDQLAADRDQQSADQDQAARPPEASDEVYTRTRRGRSQSSLERDMAAEVRSTSARVRDSNAARRDAVAESRDAAARLRDQIAAMRDADAGELKDQPTNGRALGLDLLMNAARDRERLAANRARAASQREAAARDREHAAEDRRRAAHDREAAAEEVASQGIDYLTGTLRRQVGLAAMQRELERTARAKEALVVAFIDVVGLKAVNDMSGHRAGDALLEAVARCIKEGLRPYDLIARYGGDEFVCTITGHELAGVRRRFDLISEQLAVDTPGAAITVGLAERNPEEPLDHVIDRADEILRNIRRAR